MPVSCHSLLNPLTIDIFCTAGFSAGIYAAKAAVEVIRTVSAIQIDFLMIGLSMMATPLVDRSQSLTCVDLVADVDGDGGNGSGDG